MTATTANGPAENAGPRWRGVNHLALVTPDMDATVRFYQGVLGARVVSGDCLANGVSGGSV